MSVGYSFISQKAMELANLSKIGDAQDIIITSPCVPVIIASDNTIEIFYDSTSNTYSLTSSSGGRTFSVSNSGPENNDSNNKDIFEALFAEYLKRIDDIIKLKTFDIKNSNLSDKEKEDAIAALEDTYTKITDDLETMAAKGHYTQSFLLLEAFIKEFNNDITIYSDKIFNSDFFPELLGINLEYIALKNPYFSSQICNSTGIIKDIPSIKPPGSTTDSGTPSQIIKNPPDLTKVQLPQTIEIFEEKNPLTPLSSSVAYEPFIIQIERIETGVLAQLKKLFGITTNIFASIPTITFYIAPSEFQRSYEKVISEQWTARGIVTEYSGEQPDRLSFSGKTGGYYTKEYGLTRLFRRQSAAYIQLMKLLKFFKSNGYVYELEVPQKSSRRDITTRALADNNMFKGTIKSIGNVLIYYREEVFSGYFDSMSFVDSADSPFNMEYKFDFVVRQWYNTRMASSSNIPAVQGHTTAPPNANDTLSNASKK